MKTRDAIALIRAAIPRRGETWADLGAGEGTFTRALVELLGPDGRIYAVDREASAVTALERWAARDAPNVIPVRADFRESFALPGLDDAELDGVLLANALHFVRDADVVLARLVERVRPGGRVVIVEYDRRGPSPWVPFPIPIARVSALTQSAGLSIPTIAGTRPSLFGGTLYAAAADRLGERDGTGP